MDSVMAILHISTRASKLFMPYKANCGNTCHASLTLSQFNTDNAIRQLVLDILGIAWADRRG